MSTPAPWLAGAHDEVVAAAARLVLHLYAPGQGVVWVVGRQDVGREEVGQLEAMLVSLLESPNWKLKEVRAWGWPSTRVCTRGWLRVVCMRIGK